MTRQLTQLGLQVDSENTSNGLTDRLSYAGYTAVLIDAVGLARSPYQLVQSVRDQQLDDPIVVFGLEPESPEILACLNAGADDVAPTDMASEELLARIQAVIRRCSPHSAQRYEVADLVLDVGQHQVHRGKDRIKLTRREMTVLERLMLQPNRLVTKQELAEHVWHRDLDPQANLVETYISRLRSKIDRGRDVKLLHTIVGRGYLLSAEDAPQKTGSEQTGSEQSGSKKTQPIPDNPAEEAAE